MLSELLEEIEERLRQIVREEVRAALANPEPVEVSKKSEDKISEKKENFPKILTAPEVAQLIGVSVARVYELARQTKANGFPVIRIGERSMRFSKEALLRWMERGQL